jgi:hypothetical protein
MRHVAPQSRLAQMYPRPPPPPARPVEGDQQLGARYQPAATRSCTRLPPRPYRASSARDEQRDRCRQHEREQHAKREHLPSPPAPYAV